MKRVVRNVIEYDGYDDTINEAEERTLACGGILGSADVVMWRAVSSSV
jgi:hypothetical protein